MHTYFAGDGHDMPHDGIHTIKVLENETAILQEQYADVVPIDGFTSTFTMDREPPNLTGLYEKFTPDEIAERLAWIEPRLR